MHTLFARFNRLSVGSKLSAQIFFLVALIFGCFAWAIAFSTSHLLEQRATNELAVSSRHVVDMAEMFNTDLQREAGRAAKLLEGYYPEPFSLDPSTVVDIAGRATPTLKHGNTVLNLDYTIPDHFTGKSGVTATIFAKSGEDFVRVSTSVKNENGERAVGTVLDHAHPGYRPLLAGQSYNGIATLFGRKYFTQYNPIKNASGRVIGVFYIGIDFTEDIKTLKAKVNGLAVGKTGSFSVLNAKEGKDYGELVIDKTGEGSNILTARAGDGREFIKEILSKKQGAIRYRTGADAASAQREKIAVFSYYPNWDWVVVGSADVDEITQEARALTRLYAEIAIGALGVLVGLLYLAIRNMVSRPLNEARLAARQLGSGDLTTHLESDRFDEIGQLLDAMNGISQGLSKVVSEVREGTGQVLLATSEIAAGNVSLSQRTQQQAGALEETASTIEQLAVAVKQNADNAQQANELAASASQIAEKGGVVVGDVVNTMTTINESAKKIVDIIGVIDGIAFQTNILALNAAVEAARAGEQGRGFAVVASEVRGLAQRSAAAAKEIKTLIGDSVEKVDIGTKLVDQAGATMQAIVQSIKSVTDIMGEITAASQEQTSGIAQIHLAITQMDQVTQQNAELVEEAAAASQSLRDQAGNLAQVVSVFKLAENNQLAHKASPVRQTVNITPQPARLVKPKPSSKPAMPTISAPKSDASGDWEQF